MLETKEAKKDMCYLACPRPAQAIGLPIQSDKDDCQNNMLEPVRLLKMNGSCLDINYDIVTKYAQ